MTFSYSPLAKVSQLSCALASALFIGGCDKKDTTADTTGTPAETVAPTTTADATTQTTADTSVAVTDSDSDATNIAPATVQPTATADTQQYSTLAHISADTLDSMVFEQLLNSDNLTAEQKTCLKARDKNIGLAESQTYFAGKLTPKEMNDLNTFYDSKVGKKLIVYGDEQLRTMNGMPVKNPMPAPTEQEIAEMKAFMESPVGQKYMAINNAEGKGSMYEALKPTINAELSRCHIDLIQ